MGCFGSRFDKRASAATEGLNSVGLQFHGGEADTEDKYSADNFVMLQKKGEVYQDLKEIYPTEGGKATDQGKAEAAFSAAYKWVEAQIKIHEADILTGEKAAAKLIGNKHTQKDVAAQLTNVLASFKKSGIEVKQDAGATEEVKVEEKKEGEDKVEAEGGEEDDVQYMGGEGEEVKEGEEAKVEDGAAVTMTVTDPRGAHVDDQEYAGFAETPALYLRNALVNEYFGDLVKQRIIAIQFLGAKGQDTHKDLDGVAGYLTSGLATSAKTEADAWFSGMVGELDQASLGELAKDAPISFPGWMQGWASEEDASNYLKTLAANADVKDVKQVIIKVTGAPTVSVLGNRLVSHRLHAVVIDAKTDETTHITTVNATGKAYDERTANEAHLAAHAAAVVVDDKAKTDDKTGEDDKKVEDEKKEE